MKTIKPKLQLRLYKKMCTKINPKGLSTKITIIGEIWKSRAKLLRNRLFEKIVSVTG